ncbi:MAG: hypothetical protein P4L49_14210 [Desulfosporosinus sp.]|nr:hypothetical protein [Desulfosporosinus sp.]
MEPSTSNGYKDYYFQNKLKKEIGTLRKIGRTDDGASKNRFLPNHSSVMETYTVKTILGSGYLYVLDSDYFDENRKMVLTTIDGEKGVITIGSLIGSLKPLSSGARIIDNTSTSGRETVALPLRNIHAIMG